MVEISPKNFQWQQNEPIINCERSMKCNEKSEFFQKKSADDRKTYFLFFWNNEAKIYPYFPWLRFRTHDLSSTRYGRLSTQPNEPTSREALKKAVVCRNAPLKSKASFCNLSNKRKISIKTRSSMNFTSDLLWTHWFSSERHWSYLSFT